MRADWNERAREDARYYVAFGRRDQDDEEFQRTARDVVRSLESELKRLPEAPGRRALEIGCGPGRLMAPMSLHFAEIHGVDVSDEMIQMARERLRAIPHAHVRVGTGDRLDGFADGSFDFVYSYAVFQHIPSRDVVLNYIREARRVLKPGGLLRCQLNGLVDPRGAVNTWSGVAFTADELRAFLRGEGWRLLAHEGSGTQYQWITCRTAQSTAGAEPHPRIRRVTNAHNSEPAAPPRGKYSSLSLWIEGLPEDADLFALDVAVGGEPGFLTYLGRKDGGGLQQLNVLLPPGLATGLQPVELRWRGAVIDSSAVIRILPPPPLVPRIVMATDGVNLLSERRITSRSVKIVIEEVGEPASFEATVGGLKAACAWFVIDPLPPCYDVNVRLPESVGAGVWSLELWAGRRRLPPLEIEVIEPR